MTTIAYRDGVLVADSRAYTGFRIPIGQKVKIMLGRTGTLYGVSSANPGVSEKIMEWFEGREKVSATKPPELPEEKDEFTAIEILRNGNALLYECSFFPSGPISWPFYAIGSGSDTALGCMYAGCSAEEAVGAACFVDPYTDFPLVMATHDSAPEVIPTPSALKPYLEKKNCMY